MARPPLVPGIDYYVEDGKFVFTPEYHLKRGHCCNSKCRHCPYGLASSPTPAPELTRIEIASPVPGPQVTRVDMPLLPCLPKPKVEP